MTNDNLNNAIRLIGFADNSTVNNTGFTQESFEPNASGIGNTAWWKYTAPTDGTLTIDTNGSNFDNVLYALRSPDFSFLPPTLVGTDDGVGNSSTVSFTTLRGQSYLIAVDGIGAATGDINLNLSLTNPTLEDGAIVFGNETDNSLSSIGLTGDLSQNDVLDGRGGADTMEGGNGNDTYFVDNVNDRVINESPDTGGFDSVFSKTDYVLDAGVERLTLAGVANINGTGNDSGNTILGNNGDNILIVGDGNNFINSEAGNDQLFGGDGFDRLFGGDGNDQLFGGGNSPISISGDSLNGEAGDDLLDGGSGNDSLDGGDGNDILFGGSGNDSLFSRNGDDSLDGGNGNDQLFGANGDDSLDGGDDDDQLFGEAGDDRLIGGNGNDQLDGGADNDFLFGGNGNDILFGRTGDDELSGEAGNDRLNGEAGNDRLFGGDGDDLIFGGSGDGNDFINGGNGLDTVVGFRDGNLILANTTLTGQGIDTLINIEVAQLTGGDGDSTLSAATFTLGSVTLDGRAGNDLLIGGSQNDFLFGRDGNDILNGAGNNKGVGSIDTFTGGEGNDSFIVGDSTFVFYNDGNNADSGLGDYALIVDFNSSFDKIQLQGAANLYVLGSSPIAGISGTSIYLDTNSNEAFNSTDELIAIAQGSGGLNLGSSYFTYV